MRSRRRFLKLMALATAASVAPAVVPRRARAATRPTRRPGPAPKSEPARSATLEAEIAKQKKATADQLALIRKFELPTGSEMAFAFQPMLPARRRAPAVARPAAKRTTR